MPSVQFPLGCPRFKTFHPRVIRLDNKGPKPHLTGLSPMPQETGSFASQLRPFGIDGVMADSKAAQIIKGLTTENLAAILRAAYPRDLLPLVIQLRAKHQLGVAFDGQNHTLTLVGDPKNITAIDTVPPRTFLPSASRIGRRSPGFWG